jgi:hypothetical protein
MSPKNVERIRMLTRDPSIDVANAASSYYKVLGAGNDNYFSVLDQDGCFDSRGITSSSVLPMNLDTLFNINLDYSDSDESTSNSKVGHSRPAISSGVFATDFDTFLNNHSDGGESFESSFQSGSESLLHAEYVDTISENNHCTNAGNVSDIYFSESEENLWSSTSNSSDENKSVDSWDQEDIDDSY